MVKKIVKRKLRLMLLVVAGISVYSMQAYAGSLEPSSGPGSTMKTLDEVEPRIPIPGSDTPIGPFNIVTPGSYYLTGNRTASSTALNILTNNVTIDLKGYSLIGPGSGGSHGIILGMGTGTNIEIRNGTVRNFGGIGIYEDAALGEDHRIINVRVVDNGSSGIYLEGHGHLVKDCTVSGNGESSGSVVYGIYTGSGCIVTGNSVHDNGYLASNNVKGIRSNHSSTVTSNMVFGNGISATCDSVEALYAGPGSTISGNASYDNGSSATVNWYVIGIYADEGCTVAGNTSRDNGDSAKGDGLVYGIVAYGGCTVTGNSSYSNGTGTNGYGIFLTGYSLVDQNTAFGNSGTNMTLGVAGCVYGNNVAP